MNPEVEARIRKARQEAEESVARLQVKVDHAMDLIRTCSDTRYDMGHAINAIQETADEVERKVAVLDFELTLMTSVTREMIAQHNSALDQLTDLRHTLQSRPPSGKRRRRRY